MPDGRKYRIPVVKAVFTNHIIRIRCFCQFRIIKSAGFTVGRQKFFSPDDIFLFFLVAEPLVDFILCLGRFYEGKPVPARSLVLASGNDFNLVAVLNHIIVSDQTAVYSRTDHTVSYLGMDGISKIDRRTSRRKLF